MMNEEAKRSDSDPAFIVHRRAFSVSDLLRWDREHFWHPFTQRQEYDPLISERAQGCTLYDVDGRAYLDGVSSLWCNVHGHRHPRLHGAPGAPLPTLAR